MGAYTEAESGGNNKTYLHSFRLTEEENNRFLALVEKSGAKSKTHFITNMLFDREFRVVTTDIDKHKYYVKLCDYYRQFRGLANNYNQVTKRLHTVFDDRTARYMLKELRELSAKIGDLMGKIFANTEEFKKRWL
jgi:GrpB-like predicted nucleotidyltransferase (UPF0157 family)